MTVAHPDGQAQATGVILVVEHDVLLRMVVAEYLRGCGYRVVECADAAEAMHVFESDVVGIDVVLSDVEMPGPLDGFGLAQWIRQKNGGVDVLLTGSADRTAKIAADLCDPDSVFAKPYEVQKIGDRIKRVLANRRA